MHLSSFDDFAILLDLFIEALFIQLVLFITFCMIINTRTKQNTENLDYRDIPVKKINGREDN